jgi:CrcB protein
MIRNLLIIGSGSFTGGVLRYLTQQFVQQRYPSSIPFGTFTVNILGCFLIGLIYALAERGNLLSPELRLLLATGFCGGYTTFSSFAFENISLLRGGEFFYMGLYLLMSIIIGFSAVYLGIFLVKLIL